ncbi:MAG: N-6 DNA methylase, partial [Flavobacteriaceae bacterium]|nr:N-6 DNA methylase [Flavobacteriaceae bacterium]
LKHHEELQKFYERIIDKTKGLETPFQKQGLIKDLYNKFFQKIDSNLSAKLGIVYTPIEIVDFMIHSVDDLLYKEFGKRLTDEKVKVIDPFTGTGSYVVRLLQSGLIQRKDLERKYIKEIYAREINLLAYYTADVNIESTYFDITGVQKDYDNILFTDTFQVEEPDVVKGKARQEGGLSGLLSDNYEKIQSHRNNPVEVIIGNPPYSKIKRANYPQLNQKLRDTYGEFGKSYAFTKNSYVKAFRWATDKLEEGIIAYITPSSWLTENGGRGIRHHFEKEFHAVYVYDLKGERRPSTHGFNANGVFEIKSDVAITFLIKKPKQQGKANIYYAAIDETTKKKEKLDIIKKTASVHHLKFKKITPNKYDDWLNQRVAFPEHYIPIYAKKGGVITEEGHFFRTYSNGYKTGNDAKLVNFSKVELQKQVESLVAHPPPKNFENVSIGH